MEFFGLRQVQERQNWAFGDLIDENSLTLHSIPMELAFKPEDYILPNTNEIQSHEITPQNRPSRSPIPFQNRGRDSTFNRGQESYSEDEENKSRSLNEESSISESQEDEESFSINQNRRAPRRRRRIYKPKKPYPTKNFLPAFRSSFLNYLKQFFNRQEFQRIPIIYKIKNKKCINLEDYEELLNYSIFRPHLEIFFMDKVIYRDLMLSRIDPETKMEYLKRIDVFEEAFRTGVFEKIN